MEVWKIIFLSKWVICRFHVNLPGGKSVIFFQALTFGELVFPEGRSGRDSRFGRCLQGEVARWHSLTARLSRMEG